MPDIIYDKKDQLERIQSALLEGESLLAVFDLKGGGTGFIGITSHRVVLYDKAFLRKMKAVCLDPLLSNPQHCSRRRLRTVQPAGAFSPAASWF